MQDIIFKIIEPSSSISEVISSWNSSEQKVESSNCIQMQIFNLPMKGNQW